MSASMQARATYSGEPASASGVSAANVMAAVAESAPTTRCRDEPNRAKTIAGRMSVYRPVTTGMPAMRE